MLHCDNVEDVWRIILVYCEYTSWGNVLLSLIIPYCTRWSCYIKFMKLLQVSADKHVVQLKQHNVIYLHNDKNKIIWLNTYICTVESTTIFQKYLKTL